MDIDKNNDIDLFKDIKVFITKANPLLDNNKLTNLKTVLKGLETRQILNTKISSSQQILDTAAKAHIICNKDLYSEFKNTNKQVSWGNAKTATIRGIGTIVIQFNDTNTTIVLDNCLYIPKIGVNLISQTNLKVWSLFNNKEVKLFQLLENNKIGNIITVGKVIRKLYQLDLTVVKTTATKRSLVNTINKVFTTINTTKDVDYLLHQRFGHISEKAIQTLKKTVICDIITQKDQVNNTIDNKSIKECPVCAKANIRQSINKISENKNNNNLKYLQKVRSNLVGPINPPTYDKKKYVITFLDSKTKFLEVELLSFKDQAAEAF